MYILSNKSYDQTFPYIDYDGEGFKIAAEGRRDALIQEMKGRGVSCCIEPAIDVDSNELLLALSMESGGFVCPAVAEKIAELKGMAVEDVLKITEENTRKVFVLNA